MHMDAITLAAMTDELRSGLLGGRVEDVIQPTPHAIALGLWGGGRTTWLLASAHPQLARVHIIDRKPQKLTAEPPAFVMLLRKHLEGARLLSVEQPRWERVLELQFARGGDGAESVWLVVELMGRLSNLILRGGNGVILGALRPVSGDVNRYRTIAPNHPYVPPPPQTRLVDGVSVPRLDGEGVTGDELRAAAQEQTPERAKTRRPVTLANLLASVLLGFSQELGREVALCALGAVDALPHPDSDWDAVARETRALAGLMSTRDWRPTLVLAGAQSGTESHATAEPIAFAVYEPRQYADAALRPMPGASAMLEAYYRRAEWRDAVEGAKASLRRVLTANRDRCRRKADVLSAELAGLAEADRLRAEGDALLAYGSQLPLGATTLTLDEPLSVHLDGSQPLTSIALDPQLSAVENANRRFVRYHKLRRAAAAIPPQQAANAVELAHLDQLLTDLDLAETTPEITQVREEVAEAGYLRRRAGHDGHEQRGGKGKGGKRKQAKAGKAPQVGAPLRRQSSDGLTLLAGKNSRQNEEVTFHLATGSDVWLHARGVPGAHVIVKSGGRPVPERTLREAAALAAFYSQARAAGSVPVDFTEQRYVRHMKGGGPGMVIYERERTLQAAPAEVGAG